jgi:hypothetical protein
VWRERGSTLAGQGGYPLTLARTRSPSCGSLVHLCAALAPRLPPGGIGGAWPQRGTLTLAPYTSRFSRLSAREGGEQGAPQTLGARASRVGSEGGGGGGGFLVCLGSLPSPCLLAISSSSSSSLFLSLRRRGWDSSPRDT